MIDSPTSKPAPTTPEARKAAFRFLAGEYKEVMAKEVVQVVPFRDPRLPYFSKLSDERQDTLLTSLRHQIDAMEELQLAGRSLVRNTRTIVMNFLAEAKLTPAIDLAANLDDRDFVAVYNHDQQMIFLSPNHLTWMSYSIEDLHCRPWFDMFKREETIERVLIERARMVATSREPAMILNTDLPAHLVTETEGDDPRFVVCCSKFYSPVFQSGRPAGFLAVNQDRIRGATGPFSKG